MLIDYYLGVASAVTAGFIWSLAPGTISRYGKNYRSHVVNMARSFYAVIFLLFIIMVTSTPLNVDPTGLGIIYISAFFGPLLGDTLYIASIKRIGGGNAVSIGYLYIFLAQIYSHILFGEELTTRLLAGTIIALYGIHMVYSGEKHNLELLGFLAAVGAALSWGMGATLSKLALQYGEPLTIALYRNLAVMLTLIPFTYRETRIIVEKKGLIIGVITGGLGFGAGMTLFLYAITRVGVGVTALSTSLTPVLGRILSRYIAGEKPSRKAYLGSIITTIGILVGLLKY